MPFFACVCEVDKSGQTTFFDLFNSCLVLLSRQNCVEINVHVCCAFVQTRYLFWLIEPLYWPSMLLFVFDFSLGFFSVIVFAGFSLGFCSVIAFADFSLGFCSVYACADF